MVRNVEQAGCRMVFRMRFSTLVMSCRLHDTGSRLWPWNPVPESGHSCPGPGCTNAVRDRGKPQQAGVISHDLRLCRTRILRAQAANLNCAESEIFHESMISLDFSAARRGRRSCVRRFTEIQICDLDSENGISFAAQPRGSGRHHLGHRPFDRRVQSQPAPPGSAD